MSPTTIKHRDRINHFRPFLSIIFIISTLFILVFLQMEERRLGYQFFKLNKDYKRLRSDLREKEIQFAKVTRPQLLDSVAQKKLTLKKVQSNQIIHLSQPSKEI